MKKNHIISISLLVSLVACNSDDSTPKESWLVKNKMYAGIFFRTGPNGKEKESIISITFTDNEFSGNSNTDRYPAICRGTYQLNGNEIEFSDACPWTADFDWTFILSGKFSVVETDKDIILTKNSNNNLDTYVLVK